MSAFSQLRIQLKCWLILVILTVSFVYGSPSAVASGIPRSEIVLDEGSKARELWRDAWMRTRIAQATINGEDPMDVLGDPKAAILEKQAECGFCRHDSACETHKCYFGRCVRAGALQMHSVLRCFQVPEVSQGLFEGEECSSCNGRRECDSGHCVSGKCVFGGRIMHVSILKCFSDAFVHRCPT